VGVSRPHLSSYENGHVEPPFQVLLKAAEVFDAEFVVAGYKLTKERMQPGGESAASLEKQLVFDFGGNRVLRRASIQLTSLGSRVVIRATVAGAGKSETR
jgi:transcriptional regulator with XRE-family HTH domain